MASMRALRGACTNVRFNSPRNFTTIPTVFRSHAFPTAGCQSRFNSTTTSGQEQEQSESAVSGPLPAVRYARSYKTTPKNAKPDIPAAEERKAELWKLNRQLMHIYQEQRAIRMAVKSRYRIGTSVEYKPGHDIVSMQDSVVIVGKEEVPNIWLRDNCQCNSCVHEDTRQRLLDTWSIPHDISIANHNVTKGYVEIEWSDGHKSRYLKELLRNAISPFEKRALVRQGLTNIELWDSSITSRAPRITYESPNTPGKMLHGILNNLRKFGFCYIDSVPATAKDTEELLRRISFIRETHYGGFYDFIPDLASKDTAYTNIALDAHTDTTYFSDPAGLQAFHLLSHTDGEGGASLLVDGYKAAADLLVSDPDAYEVLTTVNVHAHASGNDGISIMPYRGFPVLQHDAATGELLQVRWNSSDRASIELPISEVGKWYDAARKFNALLKKKENEYWEQLKPGTVVIFDNWRVLHGRSAFTGKRRICGGYINRDDWISKYKMLLFGQEQVLNKLASG